ncbi:MAG: RluA family pseudouridine synthase [Chloroflexi bacterium]|nr:RluA family pseudouridine synthase [Chloroflexota bacterium]
MEQIITLRVESGGQRVDSYIAKAVPDLSRSFVQKLLEEGRITIAGRVPKASYKVEAGDVIAVRVPPPEPVELQPEEIPLTIVYEDGDIVVVDKPAGMVVHPAHGHYSGTLVNALLARCPDLEGIGGELRPGIVHRLDKDTSGLLVVAKNDRAYRHLQQQFKQRLVHKTYIALAEGILEATHGIIEAPIGRDPQQRKRMAVLPHGGREACTEYRVVEYFPQHTLVEAEPITGRTHQIRLHFAFIGHPIAGDRVYGFRKQKLPLQRQFLHAARLSFTLPGTGQPVEFTSPLPADLVAVLDSLRQARQQATKSR